MSNKMDKFDYIIVAILTIMGVILFCVSDAGSAEPYGIADYSSPVYYPTDGLVDEFRTMSPHLSGDLIGEAGDFELSGGTIIGGCTSCGLGWTCGCSTNDIDLATDIIYLHDTSTFIEPAIAGTSFMLYPFNYEANKTYEISFQYKAVDGVEDFLFGATNAAGTEIYLPATDTWGVPGSAWYEINVNTTWTKVYGILDVGPVAKTNYFLVVGPLSVDGTGIYFDNIKIQEIKNGAVVGTHGNQLSFVGDPGFGNTPVKLTSGPVSDQGMVNDASANYLSEGTDTDKYDPVTYENGGDFSVGCRVITNTISPAAQQTIISKFVAPAQQGWNLMQNIATNDIYFLVSDNGVDTTLVTDQVSLGVDRLHNVLATYDYRGLPLNANATLEIDFNTPITSAVFRGPPHNSTGTFKIGARNTGTVLWDGTILQCVMWDRTLDTVEKSKWKSPYFPGVRRLNSDGMYVTTCTQAASHATCSHQHCRNGTPNSCEPEMTGALAIFNGDTQTLGNNSFEDSYTGTQTVPNWPEWNEQRFNGSGVSTLSAYYGDSTHGNVSARATTSAADGNTRVISSCIIVTPGAAYVIGVNFKKLSGTARIYVSFTEYTAANCTGYLGNQSPILYTDPPVGEWVEYAVPVVMGGTTNSVKINYYPTYSSIADVLMDSLSFKAGTYRTPFVHCLGVACSTNARFAEVHNPLSDYMQDEGDFGYASGACFSQWVFTMWPGDHDDAHDLLHIPPTAGSNNQIRIYKDGSPDRFSFEWRDDGGGASSLTYTANSTTWPAGEWIYYEVCASGQDGGAAAHAGHHYVASTGTWYDWSSLTLVDMTQDGQSSTLNIGSYNSGTVQGDYYTSSIYVSPYNAVFQNRGFNNGIAPGAPY